MNNLLKFINDPYNPEVNFWLGYEYDLENHKATAMSYYLRAAEFSNDKDLIYESLIRIAFCLKYIQRRPKSVKNALMDAINCTPSRPEAWYFLSDILEGDQTRKESYTAACMALSNKNNAKPTLTDIKYYDYLPQFQKAVTTWWVGGCDEARSLFKDLLQNHQMNDEFTSLVHKNLNGLNGERFYKLPYTKENYFNLKYKFLGSEKIEKNYSQTYQDMFVLTMLDGKREGTYLEIGTADPIYNNNTYLLEKEFDWYGISIEINEEEVIKFEKTDRIGPIIHADALEVDYLEELKNLPLVIDYLQIDCEPAETTYKILEKIPFNKHKFRVITYEHDYYADETKSFREKSRKFLENKGYIRVVGDIAPDKNSTFEDWWVYPGLVDENILKIMMDSTDKVKRADEYMLNVFEWGILEKDEWFRETIIDEVFTENSYEKFFKINKNDIVVDIGACVGAFTYKILSKNPKQIYCLEPDSRFIPTLKNNVEKYPNVTIIPKGISNKDGKSLVSGLYNPDNIFIHNNVSEIDSIKFNTFVTQNNIQQIDFLKVDCEGGEYDIFNTENYDWIKNNVKKIAAEVHLNTPELKEKFKVFRNNILKNFNNFKVFSMDNVDIKWWIWDDKFIEFYDAIMIYIDNRFDKVQKWQSTQYPTLEFTTSIPKKGCVIDCAFCPQMTLLDVYDSNKTMSLENFKKIIDKLPKEIRITFSGFTEPWLNKQCTDMLLYAHEQGHPVCAFTTGIGMTLEDVEKLKNIPFNTGPNGGFCLHLPDQELIAKHPITPRYMKVIKRFKELENHIQGFYVMSMSEVHDDIKPYFPNAHIPEFWSRAGNLLGEAIIKPELEKLMDRFKHMDHGDQKMTCGCDETLYHNVVLPNGDVSLCCMDYGLKHILGNLYTQEYNDIIPEPLSCFTLCSSCENGIKP